MDIFDELFETPEEKKYPENHREEFDFLFDIFEQPKEKEFKQSDVSETMSVDSAFRNIRERLKLKCYD
jgi:hypothetical protein